MTTAATPTVRPGPTVHPGTPAQAREVLLAAAAALPGRGHEPLWPEGELEEAALTARYPGGEWRVALSDGQPLACCVLIDPDPLYWPEKPPGEALSLHKLAVHPQFGGQGLARTMLEDAVKRCRARGYGLLRLDTDVSRPKLQAIYRDFGFTAVDTRVVEGYAVVRYELPVGEG